jgi:hypothetical protein
MQVSTVYFPVSQADFNSLTVMDRIFGLPPSVDNSRLKWNQSSWIHMLLALLRVMEYARAWQDLQDFNIPGRFAT